jgi:hypothetical protein
MKTIDYEYTESLIQDSITKEYSSNGALIIRSNSRMYFISKDFIDFAYNIFHERKNENKA